MIFSANLPKLLDPQVRKVFETSRTQFDEAMPKIFVESDTNLAVTQDVGVSDIAPAVAVAEGAPIPQDDPVQGYVQTYPQSQFGRGFSVTERMIRFDLFNQIAARAAGVKLAMIRKIEQDAASYLLNSYVTANGADGQPLASAAHPLTGSASVGTNILVSGGVTNPALAVSALDSAQQMMAATLDDKGQLVPRMPTKLIVGPALWKTADVIFATARVPGGNNNDVNRWYNTLELVVNPYITSAFSTVAYADSLYALIDDSMNPLVWLWGKRPTMNDGYLDYDTRSVRYNGNYFASFGHSDWRGVMLSQGDNT